MMQSLMDIESSETLNNNTCITSTHLRMIFYEDIKNLIDSCVEFHNDNPSDNQIDKTMYSCYLFSHF